MKIRFFAIHGVQVIDVLPAKKHVITCAGIEIGVMLMISLDPS